MSELFKLAELLAGGGDHPLRWRQGKVTATAAGPPATVSVSVGGATAVSGVRYLASYTPAVNDVVHVLQQGPDLLVLGKLA